MMSPDSPQYVKTLSFDDNWFWYKGCSLRVDVSYWMSCHMVKGQDQTAGLCTIVLYSFNPFS